MLEPLESRDVPTGSPAYAIGAAPGGQPVVSVYDSDGNPVTSFLAFESTFTGGVRTAVADLSADGTPDIITAPGPGGGPRVRAFDGATGSLLLDFYAYDQGFTGGVFVGAGPVGNGQVGIATGADAGGGPHVEVFAANGSVLNSFYAFDDTFAGGVRVALGQTDAGSYAYAASGPGMAPTVRGFDAGTGAQVFEDAAGDAAESGGVYVGAGDLTGDGNDEVVTAAPSGSDTDLRVFGGADGTALYQDTLSGAAYGIGVLGWGGQPAVGVMSDTALTIYSFGDFTAAPVVLTSVDASGWGGAGASIGGADPAPAPAPTVLFTHTDTWGPTSLDYSDPDEEGSITVEVTDGGTQYPGRYHWKYTFTSVHFNQAPPGYSYFSLATGVPDIADVATSTGWDHSGGMTWSYDTGSTGIDSIPVGQPETFEFTALPRKIAPIQGSTNDQLGLYGVSGTTFGPGQLVTPTVSATFDTTLIPVNADDDNGSAWKDDPDPYLPYIPVTRDYDATNLPKDDPELVKMTVTIGGGLAGTLSLDTYLSGLGTVHFWMDKRKAAAFPDGLPIAAGTDPTTVTLYVEGVHESSDLNDVSVTVTFTPQAPVGSAIETYALTVAPVINSFTATIPTPSVSFWDYAPAPGDGLAGLVAGKPGVGGVWTQGITFESQLTNGPLTIKYMQDFRPNGVQNGANEGGAGAVFIAGSGLANQNFLPIAGSGYTFPGLDSQNKDDPTDFKTLFTSTPKPPDNVTIKVVDSPNTGVPDTNSDELDVIDVEELIRTYLVVRYSDDTIYPIAYWNWDVNFYANENIPGSGVSNIMPESAVTTVGGWVRSNDDPLKTAGPIFNFNMEWR